MNIGESIILALNSVREYKLRASLTLLSISIGVFAIMGAGTLVTSINSSVNSELDAMGENSFMIKRMPSIQMGNSWHKYMRRKPITYSQYLEFKRQMALAEYVSAESYSTSHTIKTGNLSTDPDVLLVGADENYFINNNVEIAEGRAFTEEDLTLNRNVAIIGNDVVVKIFATMSPIGQRIRIKNQAYTIIGVLETKGAILGQSQDNKVVIPLPQFLKYYAYEWEESLNLSVKSPNKELLEPAMDEAIGLMRSIRNVKPWEENSFEVETNEVIKEQFASLTGFLSYFGFISGIIALIAAGVGIMNIMLVSVKERTREIGVRKAVGAKRYWILIQFIIETITLCQIGGVIGIILGIIGAWALGSLINITLSFPINWIILSISICTFLGVISGSYPAWKAAKLDPIEALRYE